MQSAPAAAPNSNPMGSEIKLITHENTWLVLKFIGNQQVFDLTAAFQIAAKIAPKSPWPPNKVNEYVWKIDFSLANFFYIKFMTTICKVAETTPITKEQAGLRIQQAAVALATPPAIGPYTMSRMRMPSLKRGESKNEVIVAAHSEKSTLIDEVYGVCKAIEGSTQSKGRIGKKIHAKMVPIKAKAAEDLLAVQFSCWMVLLSPLQRRYLRSPMDKPMKPPKTKIELVPPASLVQFSMICLLSSQPMVPKITTNRAQSGPALPMMAENATRFDKAHLNAPVKLAQQQVVQLRQVRKKLQSLLSSLN